MAPKRKKIALFGGSFNPPHISHQMILFYLRYYKQFNTVHIIPTYNHPFDKEIVPFHHRFEMCKLLRRPFRYDVYVDDIEKELVEKGKSEGYTIDTIRECVRQHPAVDYTLIIGADIPHELHKWKDFDEIEKLVDVLVLTRKGYTPVGNHTYEVFEKPEISSTELRSWIASGVPVDGLIYPPVLQYIRKSGLYI